MSSEPILAVLVGLASGYFSGQFGIGGGLITTPGIRLLLGKSALIALGTPLVVIIPTAMTGAFTYFKRGFVHGNLALRLALWGVAGVIWGSFSTAYVSASLLMLATAVVIFGVGIAFLRPSKEEDGTRGLAGSPQASERARRREQRLVIVVGLAGGFYSGLLGMGGGLLLIPALIWIFGLRIKEAFGTSLVINSVYALPGSIIHSYLGHVDLALAGLIILGVFPGAYLGARVTIGLPDKVVRVLFGAFMLLVAAYFAYFEVFNLAR